ncbi:MAG: TetM/TetW/TetO/TetS family tetracycline resistance ribosomal protection protein, partial [Firmicutes bacterium]|nr:TetM/TetW/TetO/TetS family tetracycline resistance ribosomal protection protein [Bacillota bacterium]
MKKITLGVLAHVDAGKTTLSEGILFLTGTTRKVGRVDTGDTFLDTDQMEKNRGITVFSKEARFRAGDLEVTLVDTPGHADFSSEMERALSVLDLALLVVSGAEGVQSHTLTLLKLFKAYSIPVIVFVNKMDMPGTDARAVLKDIRKHLPEAVDFTEVAELLTKDPETYAAYKASPEAVLLPEAVAEEAATGSEELMDKYMEGGISAKDAVKAISDRRLYPVVFGSALKMTGIEELLKVLEVFAPEKKYPEEFSATVYKITRDANGNRLTNLKVTGGVLKNKMQLETAVPSDEDEKPEPEKVEQIRLYNGDKFTTANQAEAGTVCAVLGLKNTYAGQRLGAGPEEAGKPFIEPALTYTLKALGKEDPVSMLQKMKQLEEEDPALKVSWEERTREIRVSIMGELEKDLLIYRIKERFGIDAELISGKVIYKETITEPVIGIGHYEPLRHYAEVRLLMEPLPEGAGLVFESAVSEDELDRNWQRLIMKHLLERRHKGTLTGSEITVMRISIIAGKAHLKHTEGGDFRQATYRAVRNGLRKALDEGTMKLLEPMYDFSITV